MARARTSFGGLPEVVQADTAVPGEFEERLKAVLKEIKEADGKIISFIDDTWPATASLACRKARHGTRLQSSILGPYGA